MVKSHVSRLDVSRFVSVYIVVPEDVNTEEGPVKKTH